MPARSAMWPPRRALARSEGSAFGESAGREDQHDDLVLAVALAAWHREYMATHIEQAHAQEHGAVAASR